MTFVNDVLGIAVFFYKEHGWIVERVAGIFKILLTFGHF